MGKDAQKKLEAHPFAEIVPLMSIAELQSLENDIAAHGQKIPIVLFEDKILDGRNRYAVCEKLKLKPITTTFDGTRDQAIHFAYMASNRRNLNDSQKAIAALGFKPHFAKEAKARMQSGRNGIPEGLTGDARDFAGSLFGVSGRYVDDAQRVRDGSTELFTKVLHGDMSLAAARLRLAKLDKRRGVERLAKTTKLSRPELPKIIIGDNIEQMSKLPAGSARVIFADPPYNNGWKYDGDKTGDDLNDDEYLAVCQAWMSQLPRLLDDRGSLFLMIDDRYSDHFGVMLRKLGLYRRNTIVVWWHFPNHIGSNFAKAARFIHYYTKRPAGFIFNHFDERVRVLSGRGKLKDKRREADTKIPDNVWPFNTLAGNFGERAPFEKMPPQLPIEIVERCILIASNPGDTIIDPFCGNGTTGAAAIINGRKFIGVERSKLYAQQSEKWIRAQIAKARAA